MDQEDDSSPREIRVRQTEARRRRGRRYYPFHNHYFLNGIKNNRLNKHRKISKRDSNFDIYQELGVMFLDDLDSEMEDRGVNKRLMRKANINRRRLDRYRSATSG